jgi:NAD(P)-dependent dehydrogenase (short-subunit alcohol dehydrogenase family)
MSNENRNVLIAGGTGEIGSSIATLLSESGYSVYVTRSPRGTPQEEYKSFVVDASKSSSVKALAQSVESEIGEIYGLIFTIGSIKDSPIISMSDEAWNDVISLNLTAAFYFIREFARNMCVAGRGRIVLVGSVSGRLGIAGQANYCAAKSGMEGLARSVAVELARYGVTCNVIAPGAIESAMVRTVSEKIYSSTVKQTPLKRLGVAEEVSNSVKFLLDDASGFITGQTIVIDGGLSVR